MSSGKIRLNTDWLCDCGGCHVALVDLHEKILNVLESIEIHTLVDILQAHWGILASCWVQLGAS